MIPAVTNGLRDVSLDGDASPPAQLHAFHPSGNGHAATASAAEDVREPSAGSHVVQTRESDAEPSGRDSDFERWPDEEEEDRDVALDLRQYGIYRALPVFGEPDFDSGPPTTAEEYLRRVRYEAQRLPDVVTSAIDPRAYDGRRTAYTPAVQDVPAAPEFARPSRQWLREFLADFQSIREHLARTEEAGEYERVRLPSNSDWTAWHQFCFGRAPPAAAAQPPAVQSRAADGGDGASGMAVDTTDGQQPTLPVLLSMEPVLATDLLRRHVRWAVDAGPLSPQSASWLYALTARLERPLTQDVMASLRALLKHCAGMRAAVTSREDPSLTNLNIMIAIAGGYFKQDEELATVFDVDN